MPLLVCLKKKGSNGLHRGNKLIIPGFNYNTTNWSQEILTATDGKGVDIIIDFVGASYFQGNLDAAAQDCRIVHLGAMGEFPSSLFLPIANPLHIKTYPNPPPSTNHSRSTPPSLLSYNGALIQNPIGGTKLPSGTDISAFIRKRIRLEGSSLRSRGEDYQVRSHLFPSASSFSPLLPSSPASTRKLRYYRVHFATNWSSTPSRAL